MKPVDRVCKDCDTRKPIDSFRSIAGGRKHSHTCLKCEGPKIFPRVAVDPENTKGWAYIVALPTGEIKIGFALDLEWRWGLLRDQYNGGRIVPLAVQPGGIVKEDEWKFRFSAFRQPGKRERFAPDPSLIAFAVETGFAEGCGVRDVVVRSNDPWSTVPAPRSITKAATNLLINIALLSLTAGSEK